MITFTEYLETVDSDQGTKNKLHDIERLLQEALGDISHPANHRDFSALVMKELGDKSLFHTILSCWYRVEGPIFHSSDNPEQIYPDKPGRFRK